MAKVLVAYFSASGVTEKVAKELASVEGGDLFQICPEAPYTAADLDWTNKQSRSTLEMQDLNCRPAICGQVQDMAQYDTVFLGFPIWWGREPSVVDTFLTAYDFKEKYIIPFCTSGGSGMGDTNAKLQQSCKGAKLIEGQVFNPDVSKADLSAWVDSLKIE